MNSVFLTDLSNDLGYILENCTGHDVIIQAGDGNDMKEFKAHSIILSARCPYFRAAISSNWTHKEGGFIVFREPSISPRFFQIILNYMYTAFIDLDNSTGPELLQILMAAEELWMQKLISYIQEHLIEKKTCFVRNFAAHVLETILHLESCSTLQNYCLEVICENSGELFCTQKYLWLDKSVLFLILSCDDLGVKEIDIWKYLILWGMSKITNNKLPVDSWGYIIPLKNLSNLPFESISKLKTILDQFIPLIRWMDIPSDDFFQDVYPFEKILPKSIFQDILRHHTMNIPNFNYSLTLNRSMQNLPLLDSVIIDQNHVNIISSWVDKKDFNYYQNKRPPYKLSLLLRASRDGFGANTFHKLCDKKGPTIVISKVFQTGQIIGAYTPINFERGFPIKSNDSWLCTTDSFIFSFKNKQLFNVNIARVADKHKAIYYNSDYGPGWGGGIDLIFVNNQARSNGFKTYPGIRSFINAINKIDDYEVFQITKV
ncbi:19222_t:CDS:2 [Racocetra persica]|uniref:19222_t:CDS:1 n=1 Tax=Racocetra persica TaxID=160502 RepID=A0ACA9KE03_9GLOM|nr:19222_t:CDS:2 [Racocetra persica]